MQKELQLKKDYSAVGEEISHEMGIEFIKAYHEKNLNDTASYQVGRIIIDEILAQPGCVGLRFYNALNEEGQKTLVYVGVDADGKDIAKRIDVQSNGALIVSSGIVADRQQSESASQGFWEWLFSF